METPLEGKAAFQPCLQRFSWHRCCFSSDRKDFILLQLRWGAFSCPPHSPQSARILPCACQLLSSGFLITQVESVHKSAQHNPLGLSWAFRVSPWMTTITGLSIILAGPLFHSLCCPWHPDCCLLREGWWSAPGKGKMTKVVAKRCRSSVGFLFLQMKGSGLTPNWVSGHCALLG